MSILTTVLLRLLQSNAPVLAGYARCHFPFFTCAITMQVGGTRLPASVGPVVP